MEFCRLDFNDLDFQLLFKSDIPATKHQRIRAYHLELLQQLSGMPVWPPEEVGAVLYEHFSVYYQKVGELLGVKCDRLTDESRHLLLVCTAPIGDEGEMRPGLSQIEQLMGYSLENKVEVALDGRVAPTTGNYVLDVKTDLYLIFKRHAPKLWEIHSLEECALLCKQANERMKDADDVDDSKGWGKKVDAVDDERFLEKKADIILALGAIGVTVPDGF